MRSPPLAATHRAGPDIHPCATDRPDPQVSPDHLKSLWRGQPGVPGSCSPGTADVGGDPQVTVGQPVGVEGAVGVAEGRGAAVDDAIETRRAGPGRGPAETPAGLHIPAASEDDDVLAQHVAGEGNRADLVVVAGRNAGLPEAVLADDAVAGHQWLGRGP